MLSGGGGKSIAASLTLHISRRKERGNAVALAINTNRANVWPSMVVVVVLLLKRVWATEALS